MQKVYVLFSKKYAGLKSTPLLVVAVVTYMSYNVNNVDVFFVMSGLDGDKHSFNSSLMSKGDGDIRKPKSLPCTHSLRLCA